MRTVIVFGVLTIGCAEFRRSEAIRLIGRAPDRHRDLCRAPARPRCGDAAAAAWAACFARAARRNAARTRNCSGARLGRRRAFCARPAPRPSPAATADCAFAPVIEATAIRQPSVILRPALASPVSSKNAPGTRERSVRGSLTQSMTAAPATRGSGLFVTDVTVRPYRCARQRNHELFQLVILESFQYIVAQILMLPVRIYPTRIIAISKRGARAWRAMKISARGPPNRFAPVRAAAVRQTLRQ